MQSIYINIYRRALHALRPDDVLSPGQEGCQTELPAPPILGKLDIDRDLLVKYETDEDVRVSMTAKENVCVQTWVWELVCVQYAYKRRIVNGGNARIKCFHNDIATNTCTSSWACAIRVREQRSQISKKKKRGTLVCIQSQAFNSQFTVLIHLIGASVVKERKRIFSLCRAVFRGVC